MLFKAFDIESFNDILQTAIIIKINKKLNNLN